MQKILALEQLLEKVKELRQNHQKIVFTNGCFDILHPGHVVYLRKARQMGDALIVGLNSDRSVRELKGGRRPILNEEERCLLLSELESVDFVTIFDEATPLQMIQNILPDVLVKGGDWGVDQIVGRQEVEAAGGKVVAVPYEQTFSTSAIIERILHRYTDDI